MNDVYKCPKHIYAHSGIEFCTVCFDESVIDSFIELSYSYDINYIMGFVMKNLKGRINPQLVLERINLHLKEIAE